MVEIGRAGGRRLKAPMICMTLAAASLAGLPPLAGFFSKESILAVLAQQANPLWLGAGLLGAFLTAYYAFRLIFTLLRPAPQAGIPAEGNPPPAAEVRSTLEKSHYRAMAWPLIFLALLTLTLGFAQSALEHYLSPAEAIRHGAGPHDQGLLFTALGCALGGVLLAWLEFGRTRAPRIGFVERIPALANFLAERWYLDHLYRWLLERGVYRGIARFCANNDQLVIDGLVDGLGKGTVAGGGWLSKLHVSMIQYRLAVLFAVMIALALYFFF
ncbi:MAG: proton-conducting transporter membrane subunit, partial [Desulfobacterales bacterium]